MCDVCIKHNKTKQNKMIWIVTTLDADSVLISNYSIFSGILIIGTDWIYQRSFSSIYVLNDNSNIVDSTDDGITSKNTSLHQCSESMALLLGISNVLIVFIIQAIFICRLAPQIYLGYEILIAEPDPFKVLSNDSICISF